MAKIKLTPEQKVEKEKADDIARQELLFKNSILELEKMIESGTIGEPTRKFSIGEEVAFGAFSKSVIKDVLADGKIYVIEVVSNSRERGEFLDIKTCLWHDVFKKTTLEENNKIPVFGKKCNFGHTYTQTLKSIIHTYYFFGIDLNPEYQRGNVWTLEDKVSLIDSIFNDIEIGRIVLMKRPSSGSRKHLYEMIDGKQRLTTLIEFFEDRFAYNGLKYSELNYVNKHQFNSTHIALIETDELTHEQILEFFIRVNTSGRPVDPVHLEKVKSMLKK